VTDELVASAVLVGVASAIMVLDTGISLAVARVREWVNS
jgi:hypothetical protein